MKVRTLKYEPFVIPPAAALADLHKADRELVDVNEINIPDLYHVIAWMKDSEPRAALAVNQTWMIALDLLKVLRDVDANRFRFEVDHIGVQPIYKVHADSETGEWIEQAFVGYGDSTRFYKLEDTDDVHYDGAEGGTNGLGHGGENCLLAVFCKQEQYASCIGGDFNA